MPAPALAGETLCSIASAALDKEGKQQCLLIGAYLSALGVGFEAIISSPLKRSLQTASLVATEIGFEQKIAIDSSLEPAGKFADFEAMLAKHAGQETVLVVGHNPNLAQFAGALIAGQRGARANLRLRQGRADSYRREPASRSDAGSCRCHERCASFKRASQKVRGRRAPGSSRVCLSYCCGEGSGVGCGAARRRRWSACNLAARS